MDIRDTLDAAAKAKEFVELLQLWGMSRAKARQIVVGMLRLVDDNAYQWKDLTAPNYAEAKEFLEGTGSLSKVKQ